MVFRVSFVIVLLAIVSPFAVAGRHKIVNEGDLKKQTPPSIPENPLAGLKKACGGDDTGVFVCQRDGLPEFPPHVRGDVYFVEAPVGGSGIAGLLGFYHSGIAVVLKDLPREFPMKMTVQWYALGGMSAAVMPQLEPEGLVWHNEAKVVYTPDIDEKYWVRQTLVAEDVSGRVLNRLLDLSVKYGEENPVYQLFSVQQSKDVDGKSQLGRMLVDDQVCDTFTRDAIFQMQSDGATILVKSWRYNIIRLYGNSVVSLDNSPETMKQMESFFKRFQEILESPQGAVAAFKSGGVEKAGKVVELVRSDLASLGERVFVGNPKTGFYEVNMSKPFFNAGSVWIDVDTHEQMSAPVGGSTDGFATRFKRWAGSFVPSPSAWWH